MSGGLISCCLLAPGDEISLRACLRAAWYSWSAVQT